MNGQTAPEGAQRERGERAGLTEQLRTTDGAVRQLEKSDGVADAADAGAPRETPAGGEPAAIPLGKYGGQGAPEEESADEGMSPPGARGVGTPPVITRDRGA